MILDSWQGRQQCRQGHIGATLMEFPSPHLVQPSTHGSSWQLFNMTAPSAPMRCRHCLCSAHIHLSSDVASRCGTGAYVGHTCCNCHLLLRLLLQLLVITWPPSLGCATQQTASSSATGTSSGQIAWWQSWQQHRCEWGNMQHLDKAAPAAPAATAQTTAKAM